MDEKTSSGSIPVDGFKIARLDRKHKEGGGCLIYYSERLHIYEREDLESEIEAVWMKMTIRSQTVFLGCMYRSSDNYSFYNKLYYSLELITEKEKCCDPG